MLRRMPCVVALFFLFLLGVRADDSEWRWINICLPDHVEMDGGVPQTAPRVLDEYH